MPDNLERVDHKIPHWRADEDCKSEYLFEVQSVDEDCWSVNSRRMSQIGFFRETK